ncbi:hypothetical protein AVMA1855_00185 [Acidovorax sp. SUPP1855]|uniref:hypothetical protein n=1 Tax=unclassified Acidovorax TaxID=2684926 RepID=UPI0023DE5534|nr:MULTISPECIES: hypothetical protein [unclassified Acidovorax]GKS82511.1 hypothetical protein AVMA1855_00185 [Acidovorax sp. SUPP1855]GKS90565.1 hypothetical protein AVTE2539_14390 [Acidovorax sp. SUPP2539]
MDVLFLSWWAQKKNAPPASAGAELQVARTSMLSSCGVRFAPWVSRFGFYPPSLSICVETCWQCNVVRKFMFQIFKSKAKFWKATRANFACLAKRRMWRPAIFRRVVGLFPVRAKGCFRENVQP